MKRKLVLALGLLAIILKDHPGTKIEIMGDGEIQAVGPNPGESVDNLQFDKSELLDAMKEVYNQYAGDEQLSYEEWIADQGGDWKEGEPVDERHAFHHLGVLGEMLDQE